MPEVRVDPLTGLRTIIAGDRAGRPGGGLSCTPPDPIDPETDPFLEGHEDRTPRELFRAGGGDPGGCGQWPGPRDILSGSVSERHVCLIRL